MKELRHTSNLKKVEKNIASRKSTIFRMLPRFAFALSSPTCTALLQLNG